MGVTGGTNACFKASGRNSLKGNAIFLSANELTVALAREIKPGEPNSNPELSEFHCIWLETAYAMIV